MPTYDELQTQIEQLLQQAGEQKQKEKNEAIAEMKMKIAKYDITASELGLTARQASGAKTSSVKKTAGAAKYRDSATGETWTGRGPKPRWLTEALATGARKEDFLITRENTSQGMAEAT